MFNKTYELTRMQMVESDVKLALVHCKSLFEQERDIYKEIGELKSKIEILMDHLNIKFEKCPEIKVVKK